MMMKWSMLYANTLWGFTVYIPLTFTTTISTHNFLNCQFDPFLFQHYGYTVYIPSICTTTIFTHKYVQLSISSLSFPTLFYFNTFSNIVLFQYFFCIYFPIFCGYYTFHPSLLNIPKVLGFTTYILLIFTTIISTHKYVILNQINKNPITQVCYTFDMTFGLTCQIADN